MKVKVEYTYVLSEGDHAALSAAHNSGRPMERDDIRKLLQAHGEQRIQELIEAGRELLNDHERSGMIIEGDLASIRPGDRLAIDFTGSMQPLERYGDTSYRSNSQKGCYTDGDED